MTFDELIKKAKEEPARQEAAFTELKNKARNGYNAGTFLSADEVDDWMSTSGALGQKASKYYGVKGWKAPDTQLVADIDNQLKSAPKVRQYFVANSSTLEDPDATISQVDSLIESLTLLRDSGKKANEIFGRFDSADAYNNALKQSEYAGKPTWALESLKDSQEVIFTTQDGQEVTGAQYYAARQYGEMVSKYDAMSADDIEKLLYDRSVTQMKIDAQEEYYELLVTNAEYRSKYDGYEQRAVADSIARMKKEMPGGESGIAYTTPEGQNITFERLFEKKKYEENFDQMYAELSAKDDWAEQSRYVTTNEEGVIPGSWASLKASISGNVDFEYEAINGEFIPIRHNLTASEYEYNSVYMTPEEKEVFNYLYHTQGRDMAIEWRDSIKETLDQRRMDAAVKNIVDIISEEGVLTSATMSALSVGSSLVSGVEYLIDAIKYIGTGKIDTNDLSQMTSTIRGSVSRKYDWNIPALDNWDAFDWLYNTGMSMADSVATMPIGGWGSAVVLGLSVAASATNEALERGLDNNKAFLAGVSAGAFETIFEKISIGEFKSLKEGITGGLKDAVWNVGKSMGVNASEEFFTEVANIIYDSVANGDLSSYETSVRAKMAQGLSEEEARSQASKELGLRVAEAAGSGGLMGFGFGGLGSAISYGKTSQAGKSINNAGMGPALVALGKTMDSGSAAQKFALELDGKSKLSNADVGKLYGLISQEAQDMTPAQIFEKANAARAAQELQNGNITAQETDATPQNPSAPHLDTAVQTAYTEHTGQSPSMLAELAEAFMAGVEGRRYVPKSYKQSPVDASSADAPALKDGAKRAGYVPENPSQPTSSSAGPLREAPATESAANAATGVGVPDDPQQSPEFTTTVTEPTVAELTEAFMAGVEGRRYVPRGAAQDANEIVTASIRFMSNRDAFYRNMEKVVPIEGYEDIVCHADSHSFAFQDPETGEVFEEITAKEMAEQIRKSGKYKGGPIRLIACESGAVENGIAQQLADELGVVVLAPKKMVFLDSEGNMVVADNKDDAYTLLKNLHNQWDSSEWTIFKPKE